MKSPYTRPALPPMRYSLWLPQTGTYVREIDWLNRRIALTGNPAIAYVREESEAINQAQALIRESGRTVELRPVHTAPRMRGALS